MLCTSQRDEVLAVSAEVVSATSTYGVPVNAHFGVYRTDYRTRTFALTEPIFTNYADCLSISGLSSHGCPASVKKSAKKFARAMSSHSHSTTTFVFLTDRGYGLFIYLFKTIACPTGCVCVCV